MGDSAASGGKFVGDGVQGGTNAISGAFASNKEKRSEPSIAQNSAPASDNSPPSADAPEAQKTQSQFGLNSIGKGISSGAKGIGGAVGSGFTATGNGLKAGAGFVGDIGKAGAHIGQTVAKTGVDMTGNIVLGTAGIAGTAVGGVVNMAAETSGKAFEPVVAGLRSIEGLQGLANNLEKVNGLPMAAIQQVGSLTFKAMNMSGITPTFFDPDADGVVRFDDTKKGLIVLGMAEGTAHYAAYALHTVFSYSTSESWVPSMDTQFPIRIKNMDKTRWGKNWGSFDRIEWCSDMDVETFFRAADENTGSVEKWKKTITEGRQGFGALMLIFEWGTTWPFIMPPMPATDIPFKDDIGKVVRTVLLPTIFKNWQRSHGIEPNQDSEPIAKDVKELDEPANA